MVKVTVDVYSGWFLCFPAVLSSECDGNYSLALLCVSKHLHLDSGLKQH